MKSVSTKQYRSEPGSVMMSPSEIRGRAIMELFKNYKNHPPFLTDLQKLADSQSPNSGAILDLAGHSVESFENQALETVVLESYLPDLKAFAEIWGLDRLPKSIGFDAVHRWICLRFKAEAEGPLHYDEDGSSFGFGLLVGGSEFGSEGFTCDLSVVDGIEWDPEIEPRADSEIEHTDHYRTFYALKLDEFERSAEFENHPKRAKQFEINSKRYITGAKSRILSPVPAGPGRTVADVEAGLNRIEEEYRSRGWKRSDSSSKVRPPDSDSKVGRSDSSSKFERNVEWTFLRLVAGQAVYQISAYANSKLKPDEPPVTNEVVKKQLGEMRKLIGISAYPQAPRKPKRDARSK